MESTRLLKIALVGGGLFARNNHAPQLVKLHDVLQVVAVWSNSKASAVQTASLFTNNHVDIYFETDENGTAPEGRRYDDLLQNKNIDAVDLVIPIDAMPEFVEKALAAGKHVLSEKPMAPTVEKGVEMLERYRKVHKVAHPGLVWSVAEQIWYEPGWRYFMEHRKSTLDVSPAHPVSGSDEQTLGLKVAASAAASGEDRTRPSLELVGDPLVATLTRFASMNSSNRYYSTKWRTIPSYQGGYLLDGGVHEICKLRMVFGEVDVVQAIKHQFKPDLPPADSLLASIRFKNSSLCNFTYTFTAPSAPVALASVPHDLTISGTTGSVLAKNNEITVLSSDQSCQLLRSSFPIENEAGQLSIRREIHSFALTALGRSSEVLIPAYTPEQALQDVAVIQAILTSAESGSLVSVNNLM